MEEPLPAGGSCLLGSINLSMFVKDKEFDFDTKITSNLTLTAKYNKKISWTEIAIVLVGAVLLYKVNPKKFKKEVNAKMLGK